MNEAAMNQTHASGGQRQTTAGGVILVVSSALAAVLVIAGLIYATGTSARHQAALAAAGCEPGLAPSGLPCTTAAMLTHHYQAIITPAAQQLAADQAAYTASAGHNLTAARAALTAETAAEHALDTSLATIAFPPSLTPLIHTLERDNQARATLTATQAHAPTWARLRAYNHKVQAASATVAAEMKLISKALHSPPSASAN
jgi:hypothetical protein